MCLLINVGGSGGGSSGGSSDGGGSSFGSHVSGIGTVGDNCHRRWELIFAKKKQKHEHQDILASYYKAFLLAHVFMQLF